MEVTVRYTLTLHHSVARQFLSQHFHGHLTDSDSESVRTVEVRACKLENCFQCTLEYSPLMSLLYCLHLAINSTISYKVLIVMFAVL